MKKIILILFVLVVFTTTNVFADMWPEINGGFALGYESLDYKDSKDSFYDYKASGFSMGIPLQVGIGFDWFEDSTAFGSTVMLDGNIVIFQAGKFDPAFHLGVLHEFVFGFGESDNTDLFALLGIGAGYYFSGLGIPVGYFKIEPGVTLFDKVKLTVSYMPYFGKKTKGFDVAFRIYVRGEGCLDIIQDFAAGLSS